MSGFLWMISSMPRTRPEKLCCTPSQRRSPTVFMKNGSAGAEAGRSLFRSHRGFLVNLQEVARYDNSNIELKTVRAYFSKTEIQ